MLCYELISQKLETINVSELRTNEIKVFDGLIATYCIYVPQSWCTYVCMYVDKEFLVIEIALAKSHWCKWLKNKWLRLNLKHLQVVHPPHQGFLRVSREIQTCAWLKYGNQRPKLKAPVYRDHTKARPEDDEDNWGYQRWIWSDICVHKICVRFDVLMDIDFGFS
jgi:hypothetical protein